MDCSTWALSREAFEALVRRVETVGETRALQELAHACAEVLKAAPTRAHVRENATIAVLPILGLIDQRTAWWGTSSDELGRQITAAALDKRIHGIVFDVDSPGGAVHGVTECGSVIRAARAVKPVVAVANSIAGSAAYWLAAQADELLVTRSGLVGSIGIFGMHIDFSKAIEAEGVKVTYVYAGKHKVEGNPHEPLSKDARADMQARVDSYYGMFVDDVALGRRVSAERALSDFGQGRMLGAAAAVEAGLADSIGTLDDGIRRAAALSTERRLGMTARAEAEALLGELDSSTGP